MTDVYKTPESDLIEAKSLEGYGSLERGIAGQFEFSIGAIIREAWEKTSGAKGRIWLALLLYIVVAAIVGAVVPFLLKLVGLPTQPVPGEAFSAILLVGIIVSQLIIMVVTMPMGVGLFMIGLKTAVGAPVTPTEILNYYHKTIPLLVTVIIMYIMLAIGFVLFIIPGIYLMFAYYLAIPLIVEKGLSPWQALEASRKAISKCWFRFFGFGILLMVIMVLAMIPLGIGLIWVLPLMLIAYGIVYRNIFGFEGSVNG